MIRHLLLSRSSRWRSSTRDCSQSHMHIHMPVHAQEHAHGLKQAQEPFCFSGIFTSACFCPLLETNRHLKTLPGIITYFSFSNETSLKPFFIYSQSLPFFLLDSILRPLLSNYHHLLFSYDVFLTSFLFISYNHPMPFA